MTPRRLVLVRHAQSIPGSPNIKDRERALTEQGVHDAQTIARNLAEKILIPGGDASEIHLWHSTARRTTETGLALATELPGITAVLGLDALYDLNLYGVLELVRETAPHVKTLILVGHNPAIAETCSHLASNTAEDPHSSNIIGEYAPGTASLFTITSDWVGLSPSTATLSALLHP